MSKPIRALIGILIIMTGVVMFNYPTIATFVNNIFANREISEYAAQAEHADEEAIRHSLELADAYNHSLSLSVQAGTGVDETELESFALVQPGAMIGYVDVPQINVYQPIYFGTTDEVLDKGLGLLENTSLPVGGAGTHAVISGHTGLATRKLFTELDHMEIGDIFFIHVLNVDLAYQVDQIVTVLPEETEELAIDPNRDYVTLLTCTPFGINDHRLLVRGSRIDYDFTAAPTARISADRRTTYLTWIVVLGAGFLFVLIFVEIFIYKVHKDRERKRRKYWKDPAGITS